MPGYELLGLEEFQEIGEVFSKGAVLYRRGFDKRRSGCFKVEEFEREFARYLGVPHALGVTSGTAALRVALAACGIGPGDEVITSSFTFVATVEAIVESGATPICVNIDETLTISPDAVKAAITRNTKAIIVVHMLGTPCEMAQLKKLAEDYNLYIIEDTAWGLGGELAEEKLGSIGHIGVFSFDYAKAITTGEGGMLVCRDRILYQKASAWHDHGHENNPSLPRWLDTRSSSGFNFRMNELQGAVGVAQLRKLPTIIDHQRKIASYLKESLADVRGLIVRPEPNAAKSTFDAFIFSVPTVELALKCSSVLSEIGVETKILPQAITWHFAPHWQHIPSLILRDPMTSGTLEDSEHLLNRCVAIPINMNSKLDIDAIRKKIKAILE